MPHEPISVCHAAPINEKRDTDMMNHTTVTITCTKCNNECDVFGGSPAELKKSLKEQEDAEKAAAK